MLVKVSENPSQAKKLITKHVLQTFEPAPKPLLWLLSGGSAIDIELMIDSKLSSSTKRLIHVGLIDERFVPLGNERSNWRQLELFGFNFAQYASATAILQKNKTIIECAREYNAALAKLLNRTRFSLGIYGIGADGHTAGIKPMADKRQFAKFKGPELVQSYDGPDFKRITTTASLMKRVNNIVVFAAGSEKLKVIRSLDNPRPPHLEPAQLLKSARNIVIFN